MSVNPESGKQTLRKSKNFLSLTQGQKAFDDIVPVLSKTELKLVA
jgi:hypothetical protein